MDKSKSELRERKSFVMREKKTKIYKFNQYKPLN